MAQGASQRLLVFLTALFPISPDLRPGPQRGEIYKWHRSAECERAGIRHPLDIRDIDRIFGDPAGINIFSIFRATNKDFGLHLAL